MGIGVKNISPIPACTTMPSSSWISLTSLLLITFVVLSITSDKVEGRRGDIEKVGKGQSLEEAETGKAGLGKEKLKLKKRKQKRRKTTSKKEKKGKNEHNTKRGNKKHRKGKRKNT